MKSMCNQSSSEETEASLDPPAVKTLSNSTHTLTKQQPHTYIDPGAAGFRGPSADSSDSAGLRSASESSSYQRVFVVGGSQLPRNRNITEHPEHSSDPLILLTDQEHGCVSLDCSSYSSFTAELSLCWWVRTQFIMTVFFNNNNNNNHFFFKVLKQHT